MAGNIGTSRRAVPGNHARHAFSSFRISFLLAATEPNHNRRSIPPKVSFDSANGIR
jgi:hypothetical protein